MGTGVLRTEEGAIIAALPNAPIRAQINENIFSLNSAPGWHRRRYLFFANILIVCLCSARTITLHYTLVFVTHQSSETATLKILMISDFSKFCPWSLTGMRKDDIVFLFLHKTLQIVLKPPDSILCYRALICLSVLLWMSCWSLCIITAVRITVMREKGKVRFWWDYRV